MNSKSKLAVFTDNCFLFIGIFLFNILWCGYFVKLLLVQLLVSLICTFIAFLLIKKITIKMNKQKVLKKNEQKLLFECIDSLSSSDPTKLYNFFFAALSKKFVCKKIKNNGISFKLNETNIALFYNFYDDQITKKQLADSLQNCTQFDSVYFCCKDTTAQAKIFDKSVNKLNVLNAENTYLLLKYLNYFPKTTSANKKSNSIKQLLALSLSSNNSKKYFKLSLFLIIGSFLFNYSTLYKIFASIALLLWLISYFYRPKSIAQQKMFYN